MKAKAQLILQYWTV